MKSYLVFVTGCTDPSCEEVTDFDHALARLKDDMRNREFKPGQDAAFFAEVDENGELTVSPFANSDVEG